MITKYQGLQPKMNTTNIGLNKVTWSSKEIADLVYTMNTSYSLLEGYQAYAKKSGRTETSVRHKWNRINPSNKVKPKQIRATIQTWSLEDDKALMNIADKYSVKSKAFIEASKQLNRTVQSCSSRYSVIKNKTIIEPTIKAIKPLFIPEVMKDMFVEEVTKYKGMSGYLYDSKEDTIKGNVQYVLDIINGNTYQDTHKWMIENKDKIEYLMNTNINIWN